jgi:hypothetical protein
MEIKSRIKPNSARMWDYIMGGAHNFAVDRAAVNLARQLYPVYEESMQAQRHFLQRAVTYMVQEKGIDRFLDFGSGLPTRGNVHEVVHSMSPEAKIIYSDNDPITVAFGQEILENTPNTQYIYCDIREHEQLFDSPVITKLFGDDRRLGIGFVGVFLYIPDKPLAKFFSTVYRWVDQGSYLAVTCAGKNVSRIKGVVDASRRTGMRFYARSPQKTVELITPWKLTDHGIVPGFYWGLPEHAPEINETIQKLSYSFVAYK